MSQEKVAQYKKDKANRKKIIKKQKMKKILIKILIIIIVLFVVAFLAWSIYDYLV